jgi:hypothetical protein
MVPVRLVQLRLIVTIVMQCHTVKLKERVGNLVSRRRKAAVERNSLQPRATEINALALLHVSEVGRLAASRRVGDDGRLHVTNEGPLRSAEERVRLDIGGAGPSSQSPVLILDQQFSYQRLAKTAAALVLDFELSQRVRRTLKSAVPPNGQGTECPPSRCWQR